MKERFQALEGLPGLLSQVATHLADGRLVYHSPSINESAAERLSETMIRALEASPTAVSQLSLTFSGGRVLTFVMREYVLTISVGRDFQIKALRDRIREVAREQARPRSTRLPKLSGVPLDRDRLVLLLAALDQMASQARGELGVFVTANALRGVLEELYGTYPFLHVMDVGKDARIRFNNVPETDAATAARAIARWARVFFSRCNDIVPTFPPELALGLIESNRSDLQEAGFYDAWAEVG